MTTLNKIPKRLLKNKILVSADITQEEYMTLNGKKLFISKPLATGDKEQHFTEYERAVQLATITKLPDHLDNFKSCEGETVHYPDPRLKVGEQVLLHHFVIQRDREKVNTGKSKHYECNYSQVYGVIRGGKIVPLHTYVFCSPVFQPEEDRTTKSGIVIKFTPGVLATLTRQMEKGNKGGFLQQTINHALAPIRIPNQVRIDYVNSTGIEHGLSAGDIVVHKAKHDYRITAEGKDYIVMCIHQSLLAKIK